MQISGSVWTQVEMVTSLNESYIYSTIMAVTLWTIWNTKVTDGGLSSLVFEKKISNTSENGNKSIAYMYKDSSMYHI